MKKGPRCFKSFPRTSQIFKPPCNVWQHLIWEHSKTNAWMTPRCIFATLANLQGHIAWSGQKSDISPLLIRNFQKSFTIFHSALDICPPGSVSLMQDYRIELLVSQGFLIAWFAWYVYLGLEQALMLIYRELCFIDLYFCNWTSNGTRLILE